MSYMKKIPKIRSRVLSLRLKPAEYQLLVSQAESMYLPLSAFIRHRLFGTAGQGAKLARRK